MTELPSWPEVDRRRGVDPSAIVDRAVERLAPPCTQPVNRTQELVLRTLQIAANILVFILLFLLSGRFDHSEEDQKKFRDAVACFVVETFTGPPAADDAARTAILTKCKFIQTPGND